MSGVSEPLGGLLGYLILGNGDNSLSFAIVFGLVAGMMVYIRWVGGWVRLWVGAPRWEHRFTEPWPLPRLGRLRRAVISMAGLRECSKPGRVCSRHAVHACRAAWKCPAPSLVPPQLLTSQTCFPPFATLLLQHQGAHPHGAALRPAGRRGDDLRGIGHGRDGCVAHAVHALIVKGVRWQGPRGGSKQAAAASWQSASPASSPLARACQHLGILFPSGPTDVASLPHFFAPKRPALPCTQFWLLPAATPLPGVSLTRTCVPLLPSLAVVAFHHLIRPHLPPVRHARSPAACSPALPPAPALLAHLPPALLPPCQRNI